MRHLGCGDGDEQKAGGVAGDGHRQDTMNCGWQLSLEIQLPSCKGYKQKFKQLGNGGHGIQLTESQNPRITESQNHRMV